MSNDDLMNGDISECFVWVVHVDPPSVVQYMHISALTRMA